MSTIRDGSKKNASKERVSLSTTATKRVTQKETERKSTTKGTSKDKLLEEKELEKRKSKPQEVNRVKTKTIPQKSKPSETVKKSLYFPSKNLYSNAVKPLGKPPKETVKPVAIKPTKTNIKQHLDLKTFKKVAKAELVKTQKVILSPERPKTATLQQASIVHDNIAGPNALKSTTIASNPKSTSSDDYAEDDFDSYESDFEAATTSSSEDSNVVPTTGESSSSTSEEEDIADKPQSPVKVRQTSADGERKLDSGTYELTDFKHRQILKHIEDTIMEQECVHSSLTDEGFEDQKSLQFINFAGAKKKCEQRRESAARRKRGEELMSMIKLDTMSFTLFDSPSVPYEDFIKSYGQGCTVQASIQTGKDGIAEEIQTDFIECFDKWTQAPSKFSNFNIHDEGFWDNYKNEYFGSNYSIRKVKNDDHLANFLQHSSELVLQLLAEENIHNMESVQNNKNDLPFSKGYLQLNTSKMEGSVQGVAIHPKNIGKILSIHHSKTGSTVCLWDLVDLETPRTTLVSFGEVVCATFHPVYYRYIFAGQIDGSILFWDIKESRVNYNLTSRAPSFVSPVGLSHDSKVVSIQLIQNIEDSSSIDGNEICSLDEQGTIIIWILYATDSKKVKLVNSQKICLKDAYPQWSDFVCTDAILIDHHLYVSTNYGYIGHCLIKSSVRLFVFAYIPDSKVECATLENCPFSPSHFLAGYSNGDVSLYAKTNEKPLLVLQNKDQIDNASIQIIEWSKTKPFIIYAKDSSNTIHIWDLFKSDMYPEYSIKFPENITTLKLSPVLNREQKDMAYMIIGTQNGKIYLHLLNQEFGKETLDQYNENVKIFLEYVNRL